MRGRIVRGLAISLWLALSTACGGRTGLDLPAVPDGPSHVDDPAEPTPPATPPAPSARSAAAAHLTTGLFHSCAVRVSGEVACWGFNTAGQLGDGTAVGSETPVRVAGLDDAILASAGREHTCALRAGGVVSCWGSNRAGQLGGATADFRSTAPLDLADLGDVVDIAAGGQHACALTSAGDVACWGDDAWGQLGGGAPATHRPRFAHPDLAAAAQVTAGWLHSCAVTAAEGRVACWGWNGGGQLGVPPSVLDASSRPVEVAAVTDAIQVGAGDYHTCAVLSSGAVRCWGRNDYGQLGDGSRISSADPVAVLGIDDAVEVSAGHEHTCALRRSGGIACWGRGDRGQLGTGEADSATTPSMTGLVVEDAVQIAVGWRHGCARRAGGEIVCWGRNVEGQLGTGTADLERSPTRVAGGW